MLSTAFFCGIIKIIIKKSPEYGEKGKGEPMDRQNLTLLTDLYELNMTGSGDYEKWEWKHVEKR